MRPLNENPVFCDLNQKSEETFIFSLQNIYQGIDKSFVHPER